MNIMKRKMPSSGVYNASGNSPRPAPSSKESGADDEIYNLLAIEALPYVTEGLAGIGGALKEKNEFFQVEEIPSWEADGQGSHCIVNLRREGADTAEVVAKLQRVFGCKSSSIGFAGLKDKYGVCSQRFSVHLQKGLANLDEVPSVETVRKMIESDPTLPKLNILGDPVFNSKKLRRGHLRGNRFKILVNRLAVNLEEAEERVRLISHKLATTGLPNYVGVQRIGVYGKASFEGLKTLARVEKFVQEQRVVWEEKMKERVEGGVRQESHAPFSCSRKRYRKWCKTTKQKELSYFSQGAMMKFFALQSSLFNAMVAQRVREGDFVKDRIGDRVMSQYGGMSNITVKEKTDVANLTFCLPLIGPRTMKG